MKEKIKKEIWTKNVKMSDKTHKMLKNYCQKRQYVVKYFVEKAVKLYMEAGL